MRILAATISALLISVSPPVLAQQHHEPHGEAGLPALTAEELLAQLPERTTAAPVEEPPAMTAEQILAQLPERMASVSVKEPPAVTAELILAELPERRLTESVGGPPSAVTAEQILAQLPERMAAVREDEPLPAMTAERLVAQLPDRGIAVAQAEVDEARQPEAMKPDMQEKRLVEAEMPRDPKWGAVNEANLGTTMDFPHAVFSKADGHAHKNVGRRYRTADGRARVSVWTQHNTRRDTPAGYLRRTFAIPRGTLDYERHTADFAAVSGVYGGRIYYLRCNLSAHGTFHCFDLAYPARERKTWDVVVTRMSRSLRAYDY
jgi:hypothetical protein